MMMHVICAVNVSLYPHDWRITNVVMRAGKTLDAQISVACYVMIIETVSFVTRCQNKDGASGRSISFKN